MASGGAVPGMDDTHLPQSSSWASGAVSALSHLVTHQRLRPAAHPAPRAAPPLPPPGSSVLVSPQSPEWGEMGENQQLLLQKLTGMIGSNKG